MVGDMSGNMSATCYVSPNLGNDILKSDIAS